MKKTMYIEKEIDETNKVNQRKELVELLLTRVKSKMNNMTMEQIGMLCYILDCNLNEVNTELLMESLMKKIKDITAEQQDKIDALYKGYSLEELLAQRDKVISGIVTSGSNIIDNVSLEDLDITIDVINEEKKYNIEVLCTCYSLDRLIEQREEVFSGTAQDGPSVIDRATLEELDTAIAAYNDEQYSLIRDDMA